MARRSRRFKELAPDLDAMDDEAILALLSREPRLARRPLLLGDSFALAGFDRDAYARHLLRG